MGVTGTSGTGKKTIAPVVAVALGMSALDLNTLADELGCVERIGEESYVDTLNLRVRLKSRGWRRSVFYGHLLPGVFRDAELERVIVLRCEPSTLKRRLLRRGYSGDHLRENVEAELIGVSLSDSLRAFGPGRVLEYDASESTPEQVSAKIVSDYRSKRRGRRAWLDWTKDYDSATELKSLLSVPKTASAFT